MRRPGDDPTVLRVDSIAFRPLTRTDFPLLAAWLAEPHVARWWNHEYSAEAVERDFGPGVDGTDPTDDFLILLDGRPVGLIQYSKLADFPEYVAELTPLVEIPEEAASIDYFIGDPGLVGRGLGRAVIARFTDRIWQTDPATSCIIVPVNSANEPSWRALLAAGFRKVGRGDLVPDNPIDDPQHEILRLDRPPSVTS